MLYVRDEPQAQQPYPERHGELGRPERILDEAHRVIARYPGIPGEEARLPRHQRKADQGEDQSGEFKRKPGRTPEPIDEDIDPDVALLLLDVGDREVNDADDQHFAKRVNARDRTVEN